MKASEWLKRSEDTTDPFDALSNAWLAFNNLFYRPGRAHEIDKVQSYLLAAVDEAAAEQVLASHAANAAYLMSEPVLDMRGTGRNTAGNITAYQAAGDSRTKLGELFGVIYQVRCNFIHGQKAPSRKRDVELCAAAAPIVTAVVRHVLQP